MADVVTIVAMGDSRRSFLEGVLDPLGAPPLAGEVWAVNLMASIIRCDRAFVMDDLRDLESRRCFSEEAYGVLKRLSVPLYTSAPYPEYGSSTAFPLDEVLACGIPYLNNTVAYAVALAIAEGVKELWLFGCDYAYECHDDEVACYDAGNRYDLAKRRGDAEAMADELGQWQASASRFGRTLAKREGGRACVEFWVGVAMARGIRVNIPHESTLLDTCKAGLYGYRAQPVRDVEG